MSKKVLNFRVLDNYLHFFLKKYRKMPVSGQVSIFSDYPASYKCPIVGYLDNLDLKKTPGNSSQIYLTQKLGQKSVSNKVKRAS